MSEIKTSTKTGVESSKISELKNEILNICEPMCLKIIKKKPDDIVQYMIKYLRNNYNYSSSLLQNAQKKELSQLKKEIQFFHEQEENIYFETTQRIKKEMKIQDKKNKNTQKQKQRLPPEEDIPSEDEDYNNPDEIDTRLDDINYIKENAYKDIRPDYFEIKNNKNNKIEIKNNKKSEDIFNFLKLNLIKSPLFSELSFDILTKCIDAFTEVEYKALNDIVKQDEYSDNFYIVVEGELECKIGFTITKKEGNRTKVERYDPKLVKVYYPGDYFCELNLLYYTPSRGTIKAITDAKLYTINRQTYKYIINSSLIEKTKNRIEIYKKLPIFETFLDEEFQKLSTISKEEIFYKGEIIIEENEYMNKLMIIEEGKCTGYKTIENGKTPVRIRDYKEEDFFGNTALLKEELSMEKIIATSQIVKFISFDRHTINNIFGSLELILMRDKDLYEKYFPPIPEYSEHDMNRENTKSFITSFDGDNNLNNNNISSNHIIEDNKKENNFIDNNLNNENLHAKNNESSSILPEKINSLSYGIEGATKKIAKEKEEEYESEIKRLKEEVSLLKNKLQSKSYPELNNININENENNIQNYSNIDFQNNMIIPEHVEKENENNININHDIANFNNILNNDNINNNKNIDENNNNYLNKQLVINEIVNYDINQQKINDEQDSNNYQINSNYNNNNFNTFNMNNQENNNTNKIEEDINEINENNGEIEEVINSNININNNLDLSNKINSNHNFDNLMQKEEVKINSKTESKNDSKISNKLNISQSGFNENRVRKSNKFKNLANLNIDNMDNSMRNKTSSNKSIQNLDCVQIDSNISNKRKKTNSEVEKKSEGF